MTLCEAVRRFAIHVARDNESKRKSDEILRKMLSNLGEVALIVQNMYETVWFLHYEIDALLIVLELDRLPHDALLEILVL